jgi:hypothetical protein
MDFALTLSLPRDVRYVATVRLVTAQAAREAGLSGGRADTFVTRVEDAARALLTDHTSHRHVVLAIERDAAALVVNIDHHALTLDL